MDTADRKAWVVDKVVSVVTRIIGIEISQDAPLMSAGLDSLGLYLFSLYKLT